MTEAEGGKLVAGCGCLFLLLLFALGACFGIGVFVGQVLVGMLW